MGPEDEWDDLPDMESHDYERDDYPTEEPFDDTLDGLNVVDII